MDGTRRNKLLILGSLWGLLLAIPAVLVMADRPSGLAVVSVLFAVVSGAVGTLLAGRRAASRGDGKQPAIVAALGTGLFQGLFGGVVVAALFWVLMTIIITGFSVGRPVPISTFTEPGVLLGSFFVALSAFAYAVAGGVLLGPLSGALVNRISRTGGIGVR
jgi:hypothetical protein